MTKPTSKSNTNSFAKVKRIISIFAFQSLERFSFTMDYKTRKRIKTIALAFLILLLPVGYYVVLTMSIDTQNRDILNAMQTNYKIKPFVRTAVESTERAIFWKPWDENLRQNRMVLLLQLQDYQSALVAAQDDLKVLKSGMNYSKEGMVYEYLGNFSNAKEDYTKAIALYREELKEQPNDDFLLAEIATLSMIVGDTNDVRALLAKRVVTDKTVNQEIMQRQNQLILSYKSGGLLWFIEKGRQD